MGTRIEIYYAQRDFRNSHHRWAASLVELGWDAAELKPDAEPPVLQVSGDGYTCAVGFQSGHRRHVWRIRQDRLLTLD
jgi:hypothetical protein